MGMSPFSLCRVTGTQPIYLSVYEISNISPADYRRKRPGHLRKDLKVYTRLEFSNAERTTGGISEEVLGKEAFAAGGGKTTGGAGAGPNAHRSLATGRVTTVSSDNSLPDTESIHSDFETTSRVTVL